MVHGSNPHHTYLTCRHTHHGSWFKSSPHIPDLLSHTPWFMVQIFTTHTTPAVTYTMVYSSNPHHPHQACCHTHHGSWFKSSPPTPSLLAHTHHGSWFKSSPHIPDLLLQTPWFMVQIFTTHTTPAVIHTMVHSSNPHHPYLTCCHLHHDLWFTSSQSTPRLLTYTA